MNALIECVNLVKKYGEDKETVIAVNDVSISISSGELLVIMGESGSGKTTLTSLLGCILKPSSGRLIIEGNDIDYMSQDLSEIRRNKVGFVFQLFNLIPYLTALENVIIPMDIGGIKGQEAENRARELLGQVGLSDRLNHRPSQLSGGEQQRVSFARSLANNPLIVFADEPTANLDSRNSTSIMELIEKLCRERNIAFAVVTHDASLRQKADRIIEMKDGGIVNIEYKPNQL
jgi:putative ABC transport system ATP-binding protein